MAFLKEDNDLSFTTQAGIPAAHGIHAMSVQAPTADSTLAAVLKSLDDDKGEDIDECLTLFANASKISPNVFALLKYCMMNVA